MRQLNFETLQDAQPVDLLIHKLNAILVSNDIEDKKRLELLKVQKKKKMVLFFNYHFLSNNNTAISLTVSKHHRNRPHFKPTSHLRQTSHVRISQQGRTTTRVSIPSQKSRIHTHSKYIAKRSPLTSFSAHL